MKAQHSGALRRLKYLLKERGEKMQCHFAYLQTQVLNLKSVRILSAKVTKQGLRLKSNLPAGTDR